MRICCIQCPECGEELQVFGPDAYELMDVYAAWEAAERRLLGARTFDEWAEAFDLIISPLIRFWRRKRDASPRPLQFVTMAQEMSEEEWLAFVSPVYLDAFQSLRKSILGEQLPEPEEQ